MENRFSAIIFDMDGVLADTEPLHMEAKAMILDDYGVKEQHLDSYAGVGNIEFWENVILRHNLSATAAELSRQQCAAVLELAIKKQLGCMSGLTELLSNLNIQGVTLAVASSSESLLVLKLLEYLGISDYFSAVATGDEVQKLKPYPDVYLRAIKMLKERPERCLAVEDTENGVLAANAAGLYTIAFKNPNSGSQDLSMAAISIDKLSKITEVLK